MQTHSVRRVQITTNQTVYYKFHVGVIPHRRSKCQKGKELGQKFPVAKTCRKWYAIKKVNLFDSMYNTTCMAIHFSISSEKVKQNNSFFCEYITSYWEPNRKITSVVKCVLTRPGLWNRYCAGTFQGQNGTNSGVIKDGEIAPPVNSVVSRQLLITFPCCHFAFVCLSDMPPHTECCCVMCKKFINHLQSGRCVVFHF